MVAGIEVTSAYGVWPRTPLWLGINGVLALIGYFVRSVSFSGALGGWFLGAILILGGGWPLYVALLAFFVIGTATTKLGYSRKAKKGLAQESGGRRGFSHAFSNVGVAAICAIAVSRLARGPHGAVELELLPLFMGITALATAAADTTQRAAFWTPRTDTSFDPAIMLISLSRPLLRGYELLPTWRAAVVVRLSLSVKRIRR